MFSRLGRLRGPQTRAEPSPATPSTARTLHRRSVPDGLEELEDLAWRSRRFTVWKNTLASSAKLNHNSITINQKLSHSMSSFRFVNYSWDDSKPPRSRRRSSRLSLEPARLRQRVTNTGGGNTSSKLTEKDPLTGEEVEVLWVKGSGGDLRTAGREFFSSLYQDKLKACRRATAPRGQGLKSQAETTWSRLTTTRPSISTRAVFHRHAAALVVLGKHVDHMHRMRSSRSREQALRGADAGDLRRRNGLRAVDAPASSSASRCRNQPQEPKCRAIMMGQHGFISWPMTTRSATPRRCATSKSRAYIEEKYAAKGGDATVFGGAKYQSLPQDERNAKLARSCRAARAGEPAAPFVGTVQETKRSCAS